MVISTKVIKLITNVLIHAFNNIWASRPFINHCSSIKKNPILITGVTIRSPSLLYVSPYSVYDTIRIAIRIVRWKQHTNHLKPFINFISRPLHMRHTIYKIPYNVMKVHELTISYYYLQIYNFD